MADEDRRYNITLCCCDNVLIITCEYLGVIRIADHTSISFALMLNRSLMSRVTGTGLVQALLIRRSGFPFRIPHAEFQDRYRPLEYLLRRVITNSSSAAPSNGNKTPFISCGRACDHVACEIIWLSVSIEHSWSCCISSYGEQMVARRRLVNTLSAD